MKEDFTTSFDVNKIVMKAVEEMDEFIFRTIQPFCEQITERHISKKDLADALMKATPKHVLTELDKDNFPDYFKCPDCGQALKWNKEE